MAQPFPEFQETVASAEPLLRLLDSPVVCLQDPARTVVEHERAAVDLYQTYQPTIRRLADMACKDFDPMVAEEAEQEAFERLFSKVTGGFVPEGSFTQWVSMVTHGAVDSWSEGEKRYSEVVDNVPIDPLGELADTDPYPGVDEVNDRVQAEQEVWNGIEQLPAHYGAILIMRMANIPYSDIARYMGVSYDGARQLRYRAMQHLKIAIEAARESKVELPSDDQMVN